jgi:hypothetical protein
MCQPSERPEAEPANATIENITMLNRVVVDAIYVVIFRCFRIETLASQFSSRLARLVEDRMVQIRLLDLDQSCPPC